MKKIGTPIIVLVTILIFSLLGSVSFITPAFATPDEVKWSRVNIPTEGKGGNWVLADYLYEYDTGDWTDEVVIGPLTIAIDGTLYCQAYGLDTTPDPDEPEPVKGAGSFLFKSTDQGKNWSYTGKVKDEIVDIATIPDDASIVYYATSSNVYKSTDGGSSFTQLGANPGGAGSNNVEITSIDVARLDSNNVVAVGTRDTDTPEQYGGVYILKENELFTGWIDTEIGSYDVYAVAFSPNFTADHQLVAVATDETDTTVTTLIDVGWGKTIGDARLDKDNSGIPTPVAVNVSAAIAFPSDYSSDVTSGRYVQFIAIDTGSGNGDVYKVKGVAAPGSSVAIDLNIGFAYGLSNVDVTGLAITGNATAASLLAGAAGSAQVYFSPDGGINWTRSTKPPTGQSKTYVFMASDFISGGMACAATSGTDSAFSCTIDGGVTWNQVGLIDTEIGTIVDLALSPNYNQDSTLFMLTWDGENSLWRSPNSGTRWERVFTSTLASAYSLDRVELSPLYGNGSQVVFIAGISSVNPAIWKSTDDGQSFALPKLTLDPITHSPFDIDTWAVVNNNTLFIGSHEGSNGLVYHTTDSGLSYSTGIVVGNQSLNSIALSPDYDQDETILVGNTNGWVYWSNGSGTSFEPLPLDATSPPLTGSITVAFDPKFSSNNTVYAASSTEATTESKERIYRFKIGTSTAWESIDSTLPSGGMIGQLMVSAGGTLYATNFKADGGMERCLNPTYSLGPSFKTVTRGLDEGATLIGLWLSDNQLWTIDTTNTRLMTFTDSLTLPVTLISPANKAGGIGTIINYTINNVSLNWEALSGATSYQWQLDHDTDFSTVPTGFEGNTKASSARLPVLEIATTYYWRVRATEPVLSTWSAKWSFTTSLGSTDIAPKLYSPEAGASEVRLKPVFQWNVIAGADSYELLVSTDAAFGNPVIIKIDAYALPSTAWQCDIGLNYNTTYYWKVRAIGSNTYSAWSAVGAFTTESPLQESASTSPSPAPPSNQQTTPDWVTYLVGGLLLTIILLLITMLALVVIVRRP